MMNKARSQTYSMNSSNSMSYLNSIKGMKKNKRRMPKIAGMKSRRNAMKRGK